MEFSDLRTQFLELHESAGDLRVVRHGRESYLHMMDAAHQTRINAKYSKASVEVAANTAYESAREAGRVGKRLLARQPMRRLFLVKGGTAAVRGRFRSLVKLAMERAGVVVDGREVENAWFGLLIDRKIDGEVPYYHRYTGQASVRVRGRLLTENREGGWIETPCLASADLLLQLDADAAVRATAAEDTSSATEAPAVINDTESEPASHSFERDPHPLSTLDRVNAYVTEVTKRRGKRFLKREIWCQWYRAPSEFERWQRDDARTTHTARTRFEKVLKEKPHLR